MEIGWVDFSKADREKVFDVLTFYRSRVRSMRLGSGLFVMLLQTTFFQVRLLFRQGQSIFWLSPISFRKLSPANMEIR